ncbi:MAG: VCBS repeat-containing protein, partial [Pirellulaceae bacterium]|nr:VCBS repeat-containing protein [Pirellulaceae bacterium]
MKCCVGMHSMVLLVTASISLSGCSGRPAEDARPTVDVLPAKSAPEPLTNFELDQGKQQEIWDAEHITFELERRFGPRMLAAIADRDETKLSACLRKGFSGAVIDHLSETTRRHGPVVEVRKATDENVAPVGPEVVVQSLIAPVAHFQKLQRSSFRVLNIERNDSNQRWHLRVRLTLSGVDQDGSIAFYESEHLVDCTIQDDRKIDQTAILDRWQIRSEIWRKSTHLLMEEVSRQVGISDLPLRDNWKVSLEKIDQYGFQFAVEDFDQDGDLDIALASFDGVRMLLRSEGGTRFVNVAGKMGITKYTRGSNAVAGWFDYDND